MSTIHHDGTIATLGVGNCHTALQEVHTRQSHLIKNEGGDGLSQTNGLLLAEIGRLDEEQPILSCLFVQSMVLLLQFSKLPQQLAQQPQISLLRYLHPVQPDPLLILPVLLEDFSGSHVTPPDVDATREDTLLSVAAEHVLLLTDALVSLEVEGLGGYARPALPDEPCPRIPSSNLHCHSNHYYKHPPQATEQTNIQITIPFNHHIFHTHAPLSLFGRPLIKPISRPHLNSGHLGALAATPEDVHAFPLDLPSLLVDELIVGTQVGGELLLSQDVLVRDIELLHKLGEGSLQPLVFVMRQRKQLGQYALRTRLPHALCLQLSQTIQLCLELEQELIECEAIIGVELQVNEVQVQNTHKLCGICTMLLPFLLFQSGWLLLLQSLVVPRQLRQHWDDFLEYINKAVNNRAHLAVISHQFLIHTHEQSSQRLPLLFLIDRWRTGERLIIEALPKDGQRLNYFRCCLIPLYVLHQLRQDLLMGEGGSLLLHFLLNWL